MRGYLPVVTARAPAALQPMIADVSYSAFLWALLVATVVPAAIVAVASVHSETRWVHWAAATIQAVVAVNVLSHLTSVAVLGGYAPGVVTAVLFNLPRSRSTSFAARRVSAGSLAGPSGAWFPLRF